MLLTVSLITSFAFLYSVYYIDRDPYYIGFITLVSLFARSISLVVLGSSIPTIFLGWEGIGVRSYFLVALYPDFDAKVSAFITISTNRIGDVLLLLSICIIIYTSVQNYLGNGSSSYFVARVCITLLMIGASTKRGVYPFSSWLPEAIAAPTPVRALVHSSTLVAAGVILLIRLSTLMSEGALELLLTLSSLTLVITSLAALSTNNLKKTIAIRTLRQIALILFITCQSCPYLGIYHTISHAGFKSFLFFIGGYLIHSFYGRQDSRVGLRRVQPFTISGLAWSLPITSLIALPCSRGYFSKEIIVLSRLSSPEWLVSITPWVAGAITCLYSVKLLNPRRINSPIRARVGSLYLLYFSYLRLALYLVVLILSSYLLNSIETIENASTLWGVLIYTVFLLTLSVYANSAPSYPYKPQIKSFLYLKDFVTLTLISSWLSLAWVIKVWESGWASQVIEGAYLGLAKQLRDSTTKVKIITLYRSLVRVSLRVIYLFFI